MANFDFEQSSALPWDLQRHLEALLAQTQTPGGGGGAGSYREAGGPGGGEQDELNFLFDEPTPGGPSRRAGIGAEEDGDGDMTPFSRSSLQVPFFRWVSPTRAQIQEGGGEEGEEDLERQLPLLARSGDSTSGSSIRCQGRVEETFQPSFASV